MKGIRIVISFTFNCFIYTENHNTIILRIGHYDFYEHMFLLYNKIIKRYVLRLYELLIDNDFIYQHDVFKKYKGTYYIL